MCVHEGVQTCSFLTHLVQNFSSPPFILSYSVLIPPLIHDNILLLVTKYGFMWLVLNSEGR